LCVCVCVCVCVCLQEEIVRLLLSRPDDTVHAACLTTVPWLLLPQARQGPCGAWAGTWLIRELTQGPKDTVHVVRLGANCLAPMRACIFTAQFVVVIIVVV
jgi:hypothetical protein